MKAGRDSGADKVGPAHEVHTPEITNIAFTTTESSVPNLEPRLKEIARQDGVWAERFRSLKARLRSLDGGSDRMRLLGLVSTVDGEGKTTIAIALSLVLAEEPDTRVLLLDADLRHRHPEQHLGIRPGPGLADWLMEPKEQVAVQQLSGHRAYVLGAGRPPASPWELVTSPHLAKLLAAARRDFRYVVVDCPPYVPVADAARIQENLDGLLIVVRARTAPRETISTAVSHLQTQKILGVVLNDVRSAGLGYTGYGYKQYQRRRK